MTTDFNERVDRMALRQVVGDVLIRLAVQQVGVFAVEVEVLLRAERVAVEDVDRTLNEVLH